MSKPFLATIVTTLILGVNLQAQTKPTETPQPGTQNSVAAGANAAQKYFTDVELINQDGGKMRFYTDLLQGHTVVIIPFFSTCTSVCPPMNATISRIQKTLGDRVGKDIYLISISVDPTTDTPARLKEYAAKFHAGPGWYFVTGQTENVNVALSKLGQYVTDKNDHSSIMIIGNVGTGLWKKAFALTSAGELVKIVEEVANDQREPVKYNKEIRANRD